MSLFLERLHDAFWAVIGKILMAILPHTVLERESPPQPPVLSNGGSGADPWGSS
jgi:hypothetical protein